MKPRPVARPNILFIMSDDHGLNATSCYNEASPIPTPNIDRLAREGVRFDRAYASNSICSPSRATLLTGQYNHVCGTRNLNDRFDGTQQTFPKLLQQAGYQTALIGKWHLVSEPTGFDYFKVLPHQGRYEDPAFKEKGEPWVEGGMNGVPWEAGGRVHEGYATDLIIDFSVEWMENRERDRPFCLMLHHKSPHGPHDAAERHAQLYADEDLPEPGNLLDDYAGRAPEKVFDRIDESRLVINNYPQYQEVRERYSGDLAHDTRLMYQAFFKGYLRLVASLDENIGRTLDYLDRSGLAKNTVVVYTSDNGFFLGEHGFYNKMWMYEEGFRLPLVMRLPASLDPLAAGSVLAEPFVGMIDMAPTLLDIAGVPTPADMHGRSLLPLLTGAPAQDRDACYYHYHQARYPLEIIGVRTPTAKLIFYPSCDGRPFWEYFDLVDDPCEMHNRYDDPQRQGRIALLKHRLDELIERYADTEAAASLASADSPPPPLGSDA